MLGKVPQRGNRKNAAVAVEKGFGIGTRVQGGFNRVAEHEQWVSLESARILAYQEGVYTFFR